MPKYSIQVVNGWSETIRVSDCASLDEACNNLEKALYRRDLTVGKRRHEAGMDIPEEIRAKLKEAGDIPADPVPAPAPAPEVPAEAIPESPATPETVPEATPAPETVPSEPETPATEPEKLEDVQKHQA